MPTAERTHSADSRFPGRDPMSCSPVRSIAAASLAAVVSLGTSATAFGADRLAVSPSDHTTGGLVHRVSAIRNVVVAVDRRLERVLDQLPAGHPPGPIFESLTATQGSFHALIVTIDTHLCSDGGVIGPGDAAQPGGDGFAGDHTISHLAHRLATIRRVLARADSRLVRIIGRYPPGPPVQELDDALAAVRASSAAGFDAIALRLGESTHPPSPCTQT